MLQTIHNAAIFDGDRFVRKDFSVESPFVFSNDEYFIFPGFTDVHVHFREPGFSYKETIASGTAAAAAGGYTTVCTMPNLNPVPDSPSKLKSQLDIIKRDAKINVLPYGAITAGENGTELSDMEELAPYVAAFSDDGRGLQSDELMEWAMIKARSLGKIIAAHCEVNSLLNGGYIHDGSYARRHNHRGISSESEYLQIERDLKLAEKTGCAYHVCHISAKESVALIREAKSRGVDVTCETAPHYLLLCEDDLREDGRFKMNPPLRTSADKNALIEGICDGTIDMIATDHAPHSDEEKSKGLEKSLFGVSGLETAFPILYTGLVKKGIISIEKLLSLMSVNPKRRFNIKEENENYCIYALNESQTVHGSEFVSKGKSTPFEGTEVYGRCLMTVCRGKTVYYQRKGH